jgi:hypothetical protein
LLVGINFQPDFSITNAAFYDAKNEILLLLGIDGIVKVFLTILF